MTTIIRNRSLIVSGEQYFSYDHDEHTPSRINHVVKKIGSVGRVIVGDVDYHSKKEDNMDLVRKVLCTSYNTLCCLVC
jgi:hypothetical protein